MARRRFFVPEVRSGEAILVDDDAQHLTRVLRVEVGQIFELSDNERLYLAEVETARKSEVRFRILEDLPVPAAGPALTLLAALVKFERYEWILEKATELGVTTIIPVETVRSEHGLEKAVPKRRMRWERILLEASQQSRRVRLPELAEVVRFDQAVAYAAELRCFLDEEAGTPPLVQAFSQRTGVSAHTAILLGPEGGWTNEERQEAREAGWVAASLGDLILRAETAAVAALAIVNQVRMTAPIALVD